MTKKNKNIRDLPKNLDMTMKQLDKQYGKGSIVQLGRDPNSYDINGQVSSGSLALDMILGPVTPRFNTKGDKVDGWDSGFPHGRIVEVMGPESSGKTTLCNLLVAEAQKAGHWAAFIDMEHAWHREYATDLGVDVDNLIISQPGHAEEALNELEVLIRTGDLKVIVVDSVASLVPKAELEGEMGQNHVGLMARLMSQAMRKLAGIVSQTDTIVVFTNQIREKIGVMFGSPETTPGGRALKYYSSIRLRISRTGDVTMSDVKIGQKCKIKTVKNKVFPPYKETEIEMVWGKGYNKAGEILDIGVESGIVSKSGAWYSYGDTQIGQGRANTCVFLEENKEIMEDIVAKVLKATFNDRAEAEEAEIEKKADGEF